MKTLTFIQLSLITLFSFGQFSNAHLDILSKMNCQLTDSWTADMSIKKSYSSSLPLPVIEMYLYNYKTAEEYKNTAVSVFVFEKKHALKVRSHDWKSYGLTEFVITETTSYIIAITWFVNVNEQYQKLVPKLIPELTTFFEIHSANL